MGTTLPDIRNREDVKLLVDRFYDRVRRDPLLFPVIAHVDWPAHLPTMYNFWSSILLGDGSYQGNPFQKHVGLAISAAHFDRWLELFNETVRGNFEGALADEAANRANSIAMLFRHRLGIELPG